MIPSSDLLVEFLKITKDKFSDADFTPTRRSHFNTNADLAPNYKRRPQPVQRSSSNADLSMSRVPVQTRSSAKLAFHFKRGAQPDPRLNNKIGPTRVVFLLELPH